MVCQFITPSVKYGKSLHFGSVQIELVSSDLFRFHLNVFKLSQTKQLFG